MRLLRGWVVGAQRLQWTLLHCTIETRFGQGLLEPSRDPDHMLEVLRERVERLQLPAPVVAIGLGWMTGWRSRRNRDLLGGSGPDGPTWRDHALLERLANRLGGQCVRGLRCHADHRPEHAWRLCAPGEPALPIRRRYNRAGRSRCGCCRKPRPLQVHQSVPQYGGPLRLEDLPERIEAGWWDGFDVTRDICCPQPRW